MISWPFLASFAHLEVLSGFCSSQKPPCSSVKDRSLECPQPVGPRFHVLQFRHSCSHPCRAPEFRGDRSLFRCRDAHRRRQIIPLIAPPQLPHNRLRSAPKTGKCWCVRTSRCLNFCSRVTRFVLLGLCLAVLAYRLSPNPLFDVTCVNRDAGGGRYCRCFENPMKKGVLPARAPSRKRRALAHLSSPLAEPPSFAEPRK